MAKNLLNLVGKSMGPRKKPRLMAKIAFKKPYHRTLNIQDAEKLSDKKIKLDFKSLRMLML